ncbi:MAG: ABC transporter permease [Armatimonadota bacterium]|nr:ABC transporter permease [Armatimonadota bacterium]MDR7614134.1 ABC transporter permease [Armatimonadota bacterium]
MTRRLLHRLVQILPTVLGALVIVFVLLRVVPGDPAAAILGVSATPESVQTLRAQLGLDRPLWRQFLDYVAGLLRLDLGTSLAFRVPVARLLAQALGPTLLLALGGTVVSVLIGVPTGVVAALNRGKPVDQLVSVLALVGVSLPVFVWGVVLLVVFTLHWRILPASGLGEGIGGTLKALVLPSVATGMFLAGLVSRITRSSVLGVLGQDYVRTAWAKGLEPRHVFRRHVLRNALIPVVTVVGLNMGTLLGGVVVVEGIFARPGLGRLLLDAIYARDYPLIQGIVLVSVLLTILLNQLVDLLYTLLDPRVTA